MPSDSRCAVTFSRDAFRATPLVRLTMFPGGSLHTRQIRRNASEEVTSSPTPYRNVTTFPGSSVRNSSRTCIREPRVRAAHMIQYFCSPQHTDSAFYPVIAQLERAAAFERRSGQSDSEEVMSSPTPYRNVTMFPGGGWRPFADAIGFAMRCYMLSRDSLNEQPHSSGDRGKAT